jgi:uncharacterized membrane protein YsdA (DUF1294 family)
LRPIAKPAAKAAPPKAKAKAPAKAKAGAEPKGRPRSRRKGAGIVQLQTRGGLGQNRAGYLSLLVLTAIYGAATLAWHVSLLIAVLYAGASIGCFIVYAIDKSAARQGAWRTPESTLLLLGLACGWPGAVLAQAWLRHKSAKPSFQWLFWLTVVLNLTAFVYLASPWSFLRHL